MVLRIHELEASFSARHGMFWSRAGALITDCLDPTSIPDPTPIPDSTQVLQYLLQDLLHPSNILSYEPDGSKSPIVGHTYRLQGDFRAQYRCCLYTRISKGGERRFGRGGARTCSRVVISLLFLIQHTHKAHEKTEEKAQSQLRDSLPHEREEKPEQDDLL